MCAIDDHETCYTDYILPHTVGTNHSCAAYTMHDDKPYHIPADHALSSMMAYHMRKDVSIAFTLVPCVSPWAYALSCAVHLLHFVPGMQVLGAAVQACIDSLSDSCIGLRCLLLHLTEAQA